MAEFYLVVRGGEAATGFGTTRCDIGVRGGRIVALAEALDTTGPSVAAEGMLVLPGGVDSHSHEGAADDTLLRPRSIAAQARDRLRGGQLQRHQNAAGGIRIIHRIAARAAHQAVIAQAAHQRIIAAATIERVVAIQPLEQVAAVIAGQAVITLVGECGLAQGAAAQFSAANALDADIDVGADQRRVQRRIPQVDGYTKSCAR